MHAFIEKDKNTLMFKKISIKELILFTVLIVPVSFILTCIIGIGLSARIDDTILTLDQVPWYYQNQAFNIIFSFVLCSFVSLGGIFLSNKIKLRIILHCLLFLLFMR